MTRVCGLLLPLLACAGGTSPSPGGGDDTGSPAQRECHQEWLDYSNTGQPMLMSWCTGCHGAQVVGERRKGAPEGVDFDTLAGARQWSARIDARLAAGDMPPAGGVPQADAERLRDWLACGAPGQPNPLPDFGTSTDEGSTAYNMLVETAPDPDDAELLLVRRRPDGTAPDDAWRDERYLVTPTQAWLVDTVDYDDDGGVTTRAVFDPPLPLLPDDDSWTADVQVERTIDGVTTTMTESWTVTVDVAERVDSAELTQDALEILALSDAGEELGWHVDEDRGIVAAWQWGADGRAWMGVQIEAVLASFPPEGPVFAVDPAWDFVERLMVEEAP